MTTSRLAGSDRYDTATKVAAAKFTTGVASVVLASGLNYPDALAGAYVAGLGVVNGATGPGGILLTDPNMVPASLSSALGSLKVKNVEILGGTAAVSAAVENQIKGMTSTASGGGNINVTRTAGGNRYDTMQMLDTEFVSSSVGTVNGKKTALVASGQNFPDALAASAASYKAHLPVVLTAKDSLSPQAQATLQQLGIQQVEIMGGSAAVGPAVNTAITGMSITIDNQFAGAERTDTAQKFATWEVANLGFTNAEVTLSRGDNFPDSLSGAQYAGDPKPILLTQDPNTVGAATSGYLSTNQAAITKITGFGGSAAISDSAMSSAATSAGNGGSGSGGGTGGTGTGNTGGTVPTAGPTGNFPTLASASLNGANNFGSGPTSVKYTFNKQIAGASPVSGVRLIGFDVATGAPHAFTQGSSSGDAVSCGLDLDNQSTDCSYPVTTNVANYTIAVADSNAVTSVTPTGVANPLGSVPFGGFNGNNSSAGSFSGPVLTGVTPVAPNQAIYSFSQPVALAVTAAKFAYNDTLGNEYYGTAAAPGGSGTTVTATFGAPNTGPATTSTSVARFTVLNGAVTGATGGVANPEGDTPATGVSQRPSLTGTARVASQPNAFTFTFDHTVNLTAGVAAVGNFHIYKNDGTLFAGTGTPVQTSATAVQVTFSATITQANANLITIGAVTDTGGAPGVQPTGGAVAQNNGTTNLPNTVGATSISGGTSISSGAANGPVLLSSTGSVNTNQETFHFSVPIATAPAPTFTNFFIISSNGNPSTVFGGTGTVNGNDVTVNFAAGTIAGGVNGAGVRGILGGQAIAGTTYGTSCFDVNGDPNAPGDVNATAT